MLWPAYASCRAPQWRSQSLATTIRSPKTIIVTGIRGSLRQAIDRKRDADNIIDALVAEDIGKFPDQNLAESLQRVSGAAIDRMRGEGAAVSIRA